jgi:hypothetical protein
MLDRLTLNRRSVNWLVYGAVIAAGACVFYDNAWRDMCRLTPWTAWRLRVTAIVVVLSVSAAASLILALIPLGRHIRAVGAGLLIGFTLRLLGEWVGNHYLGGYAQPDPHEFGWLMSEGYGMMMYMSITPLIGILGFIRAEFDI